MIAAPSQLELIREDHFLQNATVQYHMNINQILIMTISLKAGTSSPARYCLRLPVRSPIYKFNLYLGSVLNFSPYFCVNQIIPIIPSESTASKVFPQP